MHLSINKKKRKKKESCEKRRVLQTFLLAIVGLNMVFQAVVRNLLFEWKFTAWDKKRRTLWHMTPFVCFDFYEERTEGFSVKKRSEMKG